MLLVAMFFDDATLQDLSESKGRGQRHFREVARILGLLMSEEKQEDMCAEANS